MRIRDLKKLFPRLHGDELHFRTGDFVFHEGDPVEGVFGVRKGMVRLERYSLDGKPAVMQIAIKGDVFAEASLFSSEYHCYALVGSDSEISRYPTDELLATLREDPESSLRFTSYLSGTIREMRTRLALRDILSAKERLVQCLILRAAPKTGLIALPGTIKDLANELGLTHETVYRKLRELEVEGVIERGEGSIRLL